MDQNQPIPGSERSAVSNSEGAPPAPTEDEGLKKANVKLRDDYTKLYGMLGSIVFSANQIDGILIINGAEQRATELIIVAQHHPKMLKFLRNIIKGNDYLALGMGHFGVVMAILINHDRIADGPIKQLYGQPVAAARDARDNAIRLATQTEGNFQGAVA